MDATISKWGNSLGVRIPAVIANELDLHTGDKINYSIEDDKIILRKKQKVTLDELFKDYQSEYKAEEIDWGNAKGREIW